MKPLGIDEKYSTREVLEMARRMALPLDHDRLKDWHRRGILDDGGVGRGNEREYDFERVLFILSLVLMSERLDLLAYAKRFAQSHATAVLDVYKTGPSGDVVANVPPQLLLMEHGTPTIRLIEKETLRDKDGELIKDSKGALVTMWPSIGRYAMLYACRAATILHPGYFALDVEMAVNCVLAERRGLVAGRPYSREELGVE